MKKSLLLCSVVLSVFACSPGHKDKKELTGMIDIPEAGKADTTEMKKIEPVFPKPVPDTFNVPMDDSVFANGRKPLDWKVAGITDVKGLKLFIIDLKHKVAADRKIEIATHIRFPLKKVKAPEDFYKKYDKLFTPAIKTAIAKTDLRRLSRNRKAVMIGDGKIWIRQIGKEFKIIAINN